MDHLKLPGTAQSHMYEASNGIIRFHHDELPTDALSAGMVHSSPRHPKLTLF
jgi:hypothetical protein